MKLNLKSNRKKYLFIFLPILLSVIGVAYMLSKANAISAKEFNAGNIISDSIFYNKNSMSVQQIQNFLDWQIGHCDIWGTEKSGYGNLTNAQYAQQVKGWQGPPYSCINTYHENPNTGETSFEKGGGWFEGGISAAQMIYNAAQEYNINPQVLLVMLKKESIGPLTADKWALKMQYKYAMGYACPDSGPGYSANCDNNKAGLYKQINLAAWQLNYYRNNANSYRYKIGWNDIQYSPNPSCGTKRVYIQNIATLSLYIYTPYTPNNEALNNYPGTANCGAYGNRNFFMFFNEWFGSTIDPSERIGQPVKSNVEVSPLTSTIKNTASKFLNSDLLSSDYSNNLSHQWLFEKTSDGFYVIKNKLTNKVIDMPGGINAKNGTKLVTWEYNGGCHQKWSIINRDGKVNILSSCNSNKAIDLNPINQNGIKPVVWDSHSGDVQKWLVEPDDSNFNIININTSKKYNLINYSDKYIDYTYDNRAVIWSPTKNKNQEYIFIKDNSTGFYYIKTNYTDKFLSVDSESPTNGTNISFKDKNQSCSQKWQVILQDGYHKIISACNKNQAIDINPNNIDGSSFKTWEINNGIPQKIKIVEIDENNLDEKVFTIKNTASKFLNSDLLSSDYSNNLSHQWLFEKTSDGFYVIKNKLTNKVIDMPGGINAKNGTKLVTWEYNGGCHQKWSIINRDGKVNILSSCNSNKAIDLNPINQNGIKPVVWDSHSGDVQKWLVERKQ